MLRLGFLLVLFALTQSGSARNLKSGSTIHAPSKFIQKAQQVVKDAIPEKQFDIVTAFSAELGNNTEYAFGATIVFDNVTSNENDHYNSDTGEFICPDDGLYMFIWSIAKVITVDVLEGMRCISQIRRGTTDLKFGPKTSYRGIGYSGIAEMTTVLQCVPQEAISIVTVAWSQNATDVSRYRAQYTTFNGYKLVTAVAFTAELSQDEDLFPGDKLRFDNVIANFGGLYDEINNSFRCTDYGIYAFTVSTHTIDEDGATSWSVSRLMMDHNVILDGPITYRATDFYDSGSASINAVIQCVPGASIYVEAKPAYDFPYNSYGAKLTSFTGVRLYQTEDRSVAFTAVMTSNHTTVTNRQPLIFDKVITNIGSFFDGSSGRFTCPDSDYYLFTWGTALGSGYGGVNHVDLIMDGVPLKALRQTHQPDGPDFGTSGSSSVSTIIQCVEGSRLHVASRAVHIGVYLADYSFFTGYKVPGKFLGLEN